MSRRRCLIADDSRSVDSIGVRTPPCDLVGIEVPVVLAMGGAVTPELAAVSNADGVGILPLSWTSPDESASVMEETPTLEREPFVEDGVVSGILEDVGVVATASRTFRLELPFSRAGTNEDRIEVDGPTPVELVVTRIDADSATAARTLHTARAALHLAPRLRFPLKVRAGLP